MSLKWINMRSPKLEEIPAGLAPEPAYKSFRAYWKEQLKTEKPSLLKALWKNDSWMIPSLLVYVLVMFFNIIGPILILRVIEITTYQTQLELAGSSSNASSLSGDDGLFFPTAFSEPSSDGLFYSFMVLLAYFLQKVTDLSSLLMSQRAGLKVRSALAAAIFSKTLVLSPQARAGKNSGEILQVMSEGVERTRLAAEWVGPFFLGVLELIAVLVVLGLLLSYSIVAGLVLALTVAGISVLLSRRMGKLIPRKLRAQGFRMQLIGECLSSIKTVKYNGWESKLIEKIEETRSEELSLIKRFLLTTGSNFTLLVQTPVIISLGIFIVYAAAIGTLPDRKLFPSIILINLLRARLWFFPTAYDGIVAGRAALKNIQTFLLLEEEQPESKRDEFVVKKHAIIAKHATFQWPLADKPSLQDLNLRIRKGSLVAVIGGVGSGKSSFLTALLGELPRISGKLQVPRRKAYVPQVPWITNATVRDNILFGQPFDQDRYDASLQACALHHDLQLLANGDLTMIGDQGINLSGGQKMRISLARAAYSLLDVQLMDDPLGALDAKVARHVFENLLVKHLAGTTRIVVTNQTQFVPQCDYIICLRDGLITDQGTFEELRPVLPQYGYQGIGESAGKTGAEDGGDIAAILKAEAAPAAAPPKERGKGEGVEKGSAAKTYLWSLAGASQNYWLQALNVAIAVVVNVCLTAGFVGVMLMLVLWTGQVIPGAGWGTYMGIFAGAFGFFAIFIALRSVHHGIAAYLTAKKLHRQILTAVFRSPMSYFDSTPIGHITSYFGADMHVIDTQYYMPLATGVNAIVMLLLVAIGVCILIPPYAAVVVVLALQFGLSITFFNPRSHQRKLKIALSTKPINSFFNEVIQGTASIKAFGVSSQFRAKNLGQVSANIADHWNGLLYERWYNWQLALGSIVGMFAPCVILVYYSPTSSLAAILPAGSLGGYAIFMASNVGSIFESISRQLFPELQRCLGILHSLRQMSWLASEKLEGKSPRQWPKAGRVEFRKVELRYRPELEPVLRNLSCVIEPGEKIGIVGRTGAGKSSLTVALFRLVELSGGKILIDGEDITKISIDALRAHSRIAMIAQDPIMFSGKLRENMDPFGDYTEEELSNVMKELRLDFDLDMLVQERGSNFSVGTRQLLALGRALLKQPALLVMDEATASLDNNTDTLIQSLIREKFANVTVLTIAHRLQTVMDSSRILVMADGSIAEFDTPLALLADENSIFSSMVNATGPRTARYLAGLAAKGQKKEQKGKKANKQQMELEESETTQTPKAKARKQKKEKEKEKKPAGKATQKGKAKAKAKPVEKEKKEVSESSESEEPSSSSYDVVSDSSSSISSRQSSADQPQRRKQRQASPGPTELKKRKK